MSESMSLDENLLSEARELTGIEGREAIINEALKLFVQVRRQDGLRRLRGKVTWEGNLDELRRGRWFDADS